MKDTVDQLYEMDTGLISDALKIRFFPHVTHEGRGARLCDIEGRQFLDFSAGWAVANTGYSHPHVKQAVIAQLERTTFGGLLSSMHQPALLLAEKLVELLPGDFHKKVWYGLSGSDGSEAAGRLLHLATGKRPMVSFIGAYHGSTAASKIDGQGARRAGQVAAGRVFVDGKGIGDVHDIVLRDRRHLSEGGLVLAVIGLSQHSGELVAGPELVSRGVTGEEAGTEVMEGARTEVLAALDAMDSESRTDAAEVQNEVRRAPRRYFRRLERRAVILPFVIEM